MGRLRRLLARLLDRLADAVRPPAVNHVGRRGRGDAVDRWTSASLTYHSTPGDYCIEGENAAEITSTALVCVARWASVHPEMRTWLDRIGRYTFEARVEIELRPCLDGRVRACGPIWRAE